MGSRTSAQHTGIPRPVGFRWEPAFLLHFWFYLSMQEPNKYRLSSPQTEGRKSCAVSPGLTPLTCTPDVTGRAGPSHQSRACRAVLNSFS